MPSVATWDWRTTKARGRHLTHCIRTLIIGQEKGSDSALAQLSHGQTGDTSHSALQTCYSLISDDLRMFLMELTLWGGWGDKLSLLLLLIALQNHAISLPKNRWI